MRKLASIQTITNIEPIENADAIELAHVLGWQCVVKKNEVAIGDKVVYFEIDSFLPIRPEFEFLRGSSYRNSELLGEGFKLKTMKFRGQISQGLVLPISIFKEIDPNIEINTEPQLLIAQNYNKINKDREKRICDIENILDTINVTPNYC